MAGVIYGLVYKITDWMKAVRSMIKDRDFQVWSEYKWTQWVRSSGYPLLEICISETCPETKPCTQPCKHNRLFVTITNLPREDSNEPISLSKYMGEMKLEKEQFDRFQDEMDIPCEGPDWFAYPI